MQKLIVLLLFLSPYFIQAQETFVVSGKVTDEKKEAISVGYVFLFTKENDTFFRYTTLMEGRFSLDNIPKGSY